MFAHEIGNEPPKGGLAHLNDALGGRLLDLRKEGYFRARAGESLLIALPPATVSATALLVVGLGDPEGWTAAGLSAAVQTAAVTASALGARSVAIAPSMLDSGLPPEQTQGAPAHMIEGLVAALDASARLQEIGLAPRPALERWFFDVGAARFEQAVEQFRAELERQ